MTDSRFGRGQGSIPLNVSLTCNGVEDNLFDCNKDLTVRCPDDHSADAGVRCASKFNTVMLLVTCNLSLLSILFGYGTSFMDF